MHFPCFFLAFFLCNNRAVPDGMIVLFSGMGPGAQEQLNVGVGALAGSTVMLITVPWLLSVYAGRVDIEVWGGACASGILPLARN